jgi:2-keto-3-deoxy-L-rhamnonate aldolase RhmA
MNDSRATTAASGSASPADTARLRNPALERMQAGHPALIATVRDARSGDIARMLKVCGFDIAVIDLEHNALPADAVHEICMTSIDIGLTPIVRVPDHAPGPISQALAHAAMGVLVPHVSTPEEAKAIAHAARFAPAGHRAVAPLFPQFGYRSIDKAQSIAEIEAATMVMLLIETPEGIENVDAIAAVPGIDVLFLGSADLGQSMGLTGQYTHPAFEKAELRLIEACRRHGRIPGIGGITRPEQYERALNAGMLCISAGTDTGYLMAGAAQQASMVRAFFPRAG